MNPSFCHDDNPQRVPCRLPGIHFFLEEEQRITILGEKEVFFFANSHVTKEQSLKGFTHFCIQTSLRLAADAVGPV